MFRSAAWYTHFATSLIGTAPKLARAKKLAKQGKEEERKQYVYEVTSKWAKSQLKISGSNVTVYGEENLPEDNIPVVFMSNHQSNFDIALFMVHIDYFKGFVAKEELSKVPILKGWMEQLGCVFMDRDDLRKSVKTIIEGIKFIKGGHSLVIFPEGTRSKGGPVGEFKAGSFKLATKPKVPIIPVTINGSYKAMESNGNRIKPADIELYIHPMIETANLSKEEMNQLPDKVKTIITSKLDQKETGNLKD